MSEQVNRQKSRLRAVLLDFYGTVVVEDDDYAAEVISRVAAASGASEQDVAAYWRAAFKRMCEASYGEAYRLQRDIEWAGIEEILSHFDADLEVKPLWEIMETHVSTAPMFADSRAALEQIDLPICVVSNIDNRELESAMKTHGLSFETVVTSEDCRAYKPRAEIFVKAIEILGMERDEVLMVGDSWDSDVRGANALGIPVLWMNRKNRPRRADGSPDFESRDLGGLVDVLNRSFG